MTGNTMKTVDLSTKAQGNQADAHPNQKAIMTTKQISEIRST